MFFGCYNINIHRYSTQSTKGTFMFHCAKFVTEFQMEGDYLEFGVFDGRTMSLAWQTIGRRMNRMRFVGFDSFAGIQDAMPDEDYADFDYYSNIETLNHHMTCVGADPERVLTV